MVAKTSYIKPIEIIGIECGLLSRVSQKIVATKWRIYKGKISPPPGHFVQKQTVIFEENPKRRIYKGKFVCQIGPRRVTERAFYI